MEDQVKCATCECECHCDTVVCKHYESLTRKSNIDIHGDHKSTLTPFFNSLPMSIKNKIVALPSI